MIYYFCYPACLLDVRALFVSATAMGKKDLSLGLEKSTRSPSGSVSFGFPFLQSDPHLHNNVHFRELFLHVWHCPSLRSVLQ